VKKDEPEEEEKTLPELRQEEQVESALEGWREDEWGRPRTALRFLPSRENMVGEMSGLSLQFLQRVG
jgi:hypothetical protein